MSTCVDTPFSVSEPCEREAAAWHQCAEAHQSSGFNHFTLILPRLIDEQQRGVGLAEAPVPQPVVVRQAAALGAAGARNQPIVCAHAARSAYIGGSGQMYELIVACGSRRRRGGGGGGEGGGGGGGTHMTARLTTNSTSVIRSNVSSAFRMLYLARSLVARCGASWPAMGGRGCLPSRTLPRYCCALTGQIYAIKTRACNVSTPDDAIGRHPP
jgi:hypothetical protein